MQAVALTYQVYQLHHSTLELGILGLVRLIPALVFALQTPRFHQASR